MSERASAPGRRIDLRRLVPGIARLRHYERGWLRSDTLAGVTVAAYLVPQVMAYAEVAGLPAVAGLWASIGSLVVYAAVGSSPQLSVGPESTTALMTAVALGSLASGDPGRYAALAAALAVLVGVMCVGAWLLRLGFLAELLSRPVMIGYMAGVAVIMIASQLGKITRLPNDADTFGGQMRYIAQHASKTHIPTLALALVVLLFLFAVGHIFPRAPVLLAGMLLSAGAVAVLGLEHRGIRVVGDLSAGLPRLQLADVTWGDVVSLVPPAMGVALVAFSDNVLTARAFATRGGYGVDSNQELLALGAVNVASGLTQGFPVSSSASRTVIADTAGGRSQVYSLIALACVVATVMFLHPVLAAFPAAALGAVVVYAAVRLVDVPEIRRIARFRLSELMLLLSTAVGVLAIGVLDGVVVAIALSVLDLVRRVTRPHAAILGYARRVAGMHDIEDYPHARRIPGLVVYRYDSPLFFANAEDFRSRALAAVASSPTPVGWLLINAEANVSVDITALDALERLRAEMESRGIVFAMARVKQELLDDLARGGFLSRMEDGRIFATLPMAVHAYVSWYSRRHGAPPPGTLPPDPPPSPFEDVEDPP